MNKVDLSKKYIVKIEKKTQEQEVADHMRRFGFIDVFSAFMILRVTQLGTRIWNLENKHGFIIDHKPMLNELTKKRYTIYSIVEEPPEA